tara:strand:- start:7585 stop:8334 length:750 start_codon:yes stop_codon:yes gene_type:complete
MKENMWSNGYKLIKINKEKKIINLRKKFLSIFNLACKLNNYKAIKNDYDIYQLYKKKKDIWIAAYDQIRMLPDIYEIIDSNFINLVSKNTGIKIPAFTSKPVVRVCMPEDIGTGRAETHIDYPSHRGSANAVTVWFPLQSTNEINGTLRIIPKSHKTKTWTGSIMKNTVQRKDLSSKIIDNKLQNINVKISEALIISQFLVHSSGTNLSNNIRFSIDFRLNDLSDRQYALRKYYLNQGNFYKKTGRGND